MNFEKFNKNYKIILKLCEINNIEYNQISIDIDRDNDQITIIIFDKDGKRLDNKKTRKMIEDANKFLDSFKKDDEILKKMGFKE